MRFLLSILLPLVLKLQPVVSALVLLTDFLDDDLSLGVQDWVLEHVVVCCFEDRLRLDHELVLELVVVIQVEVLVVPEDLLDLRRVVVLLLRGTLEQAEFAGLLLENVQVMALLRAFALCFARGLRFVRY